MLQDADLAPTKPYERQQSTARRVASAGGCVSAAQQAVDCAAGKTGAGCTWSEDAAQQVLTQLQSTAASSATRPPQIASDTHTSLRHQIGSQVAFAQLCGDAPSRFQSQILCNGQRLMQAWPRHPANAPLHH